MCPPPADSRWQPGLTAGDYRVQLLVEDGGANDADQSVNAQIALTGMLATASRFDVANSVSTVGTVSLSYLALLLS